MQFSRAYREGQKVSRELDIHDASKGLRHGRVSRVYSSYDSSDLRFRYDEMYEVLWNDGETSGGFLRHGLTPVASDKQAA
jgi:hypothetical protein